MLDAFSSYMKPLKAHDILSSFTAQYSLEEAQQLKPDVLYASQMIKDMCFSEICIGEK